MFFYVLVSYIYGRRVPEGIKKGITIIHYKDERFSSLAESEVLSNLNINGGKNSYHGYIAEGSFCPTKTGYYRLKIAGKRSTNIVFMGKLSNIMTIEGKCDNGYEDHVTDRYYLYANKCYPVEARMITGCALFNYSFALYASFNDGGYIITNDLINKKYSGCMPDYFEDAYLPQATKRRNTRKFISCIRVFL